MEKRATDHDRELARSMASEKRMTEDLNRVEDDLAHRCDELKRITDLSAELQREKESLCASRFDLVAENQSMNTKVFTVKISIW